jgi:hypothetical protein
VNPDEEHGHEDDASLELVMPFVVCASNGGAYHDDSFVAGVRYGQTAHVLEHRALLDSLPWTPDFPFEPALVPQLDLLAMDLGLAMTTDPWEDGGDWVFVTFSAAAAEPGVAA